MRRRTLFGAALGASAIFGAGLGAGVWWSRASGRVSPHRAAVPPPVRKDGERGLNVLLIVTDQERAALPSALPLPGHAWLAERGVRFDRWHVNTTPCSPSRSNIYFGQHTQRTGMNVNLGVFPEPQINPLLPSMGHYFRANGYYTAYKGKWHLSDVQGHHELTYGRYPSSTEALEPFGFADFNFDGDPHGSTWTGFRTDGQIAAQSAAWLHDKGKGLAEQGKPWMLAVNFVNPHDVMYFATEAAQIATRRQPNYLAPLSAAPDSAIYRERWTMGLPANRGDSLADKPYAHRNYREFCNMAFGQVANTEAAWSAYQNYYFNCIRDADQHLLTVLQALQSSGQLDRTVIMFTSDHGEMAGAHGLRQKGPFMYDENTRVPMIVVHPDMKGGTRTSSLGSAVDTIPTALELAGFKNERIKADYGNLSGVSAAAAAGNTTTTTERDRRGILFNYNTTHYIDSSFVEELVVNGVTSDRWMPFRAMAAGMRPMPSRDNVTLFRGFHDGQYKFARYFKPSSHHIPNDVETLIKHNELELYDLATDPLELNNLAKPSALGNTDVRSALQRHNAKLNQLVATEVGVDLGDELPGFDWMKRL